MIKSTVMVRSCRLSTEVLLHKNKLLLIIMGMDLSDKKSIK
jgi:hypothetical protein